MKQKKGSFFLVDAFIGLSVLVLAVVIINNFSVQEPTTRQGYSTLQDYLDFLHSTEVRDYNNGYMEKSIREGYVTNLDDTLFVQIARFHSMQGPTFNGDENATKLVENTRKILPARYKLNYIIGGTRLTSDDLSTQDDASVLLVSKKIAFFIQEDGTMYGPETVEVTIWQ